MVDAKRITDYYAALNELAALLADYCITVQEYYIQRNLMWYLNTEANHADDNAAGAVPNADAE